MAKIIGISSGIVNDINTMNYGPEKIELNMSYITAVTIAGGIPVILPSVTDSESIEKYAKLIDGLLLSGGGDVLPNLFGEQPLKKLGNVCPERDEFEIKLVKLTAEKRKPIFGICRGMQLINIAFGGSLYQDIENEEKYYIQHGQQAKGYVATHKVNLKQDCKLAAALKGCELTTNSFHHQALKNVAKGFEAIGWSEDGLIEAIENTDNENIIFGVQWHPERMASTQNEARMAFEYLLKNCK